MIENIEKTFKINFYVKKACNKLFNTLLMVFNVNPIDFNVKNSKININILKGLVFIYYIGVLC